jgi:mono/diheme cytochrome c family protein
MTSGYRVGILLAVCVSGLLYGGIVQGQSEAKVPRGDTARGKTLFVRNCAGCHGAAGGGDGYRLLGPDPANLTAPSTSRKSDAELLKTIHNGKPNMPAWKGNLSESQSRDVLAYVRTLGK